jgi:hypothetical protein
MSIMGLTIAQYVRTVTTDRSEALRTAIKSRMDDLDDGPISFNIVGQTNRCNRCPGINFWRLLSGSKLADQDVIVHLAAIFLEENWPLLKGLPNFILLAKVALKKNVTSKAAIDSTDKEFDLIISQLASLSTIATNLDSYLEMHPNSIHPQISETDIEMADVDPFENHRQRQTNYHIC